MKTTSGMNYSEWTIIVQALSIWATSLERDNQERFREISDVMAKAQSTVHGFYVSMIQNKFTFDDPELEANVRRLNNDRVHLLPPTFIPTNEQEVQFKGWIDAQSYQGLLNRWRNAPSGDLIFTGPIGEYYGKRMAYMRNLEPDNGVAASKAIGWDK